MPERRRDRPGIAAGAGISTLGKGKAAYDANDGFIYKKGRADVHMLAASNGLLNVAPVSGTARGGILVAISAKHKLPVYFIGVGEGIDDLEPFEAKDFAEAIAGVGA